MDIASIPDDVSHRRKTILTAVLFLVTILPLTYYFSVGVWPESQENFSQLVYVFGVLGSTHVGMTINFYIADRRFNDIIRANKLRYYVFPALVTAIAFVVFLKGSPQVIFAYFMVHYAWLLWHFNKQNWGLLSIFNGSDGLSRVSQVEKVAFYCLPIGPVIYTSTVYPQLTEYTAALGPWFRVAGMTVFAISAMVLVYGSFAVRKVRAPITAAWVLLSIVFFVPAVTSTNAAIATAFFAHPVQYIVMMIVMAGVGHNASRFAAAARIMGVLIIGVTIWAIFLVLNNPMSFDYIGAKFGLAAAYGITQWHFIADAGLWKLRNPEVRKNFMDSFGFMFRR